MGCDSCHQFVAQAEGDDVGKEPVYQVKPFRHPGPRPNIYESGTCPQCHAADAEPLGHSFEATHASREPAAEGSAIR